MISSQIVCSCQWSDLTRGGALHPLMLQMGRKNWLGTHRDLWPREVDCWRINILGVHFWMLFLFEEPFFSSHPSYSSQSFKRWCFMTLWSDYLGIGGLWNRLLSGVVSEICCIKSPNVSYVWQIHYLYTSSVCHKVDHCLGSASKHLPSPQKHCYKMLFKVFDVNMLKILYTDCVALARYLFSNVSYCPLVLDCMHVSCFRLTYKYEPA